MTQAEKMAEEWWKKGADEYDLALFSDKGHEMLKQLITEVAKRTRYECIMAIDKRIAIPYDDDTKIAVRNARWEDEEV